VFRFRKLLMDFHVWDWELCGKLSGEFNFGMYPVLPSLFYMKLT